MHQHHGGCAQMDCALEDFTRIDRRVINGAFSHNLVGNELVLAVEKQHAKHFMRPVLQVELHIGQQSRAGTQDHLCLCPLAGGTHHQCLYAGEVDRRDLADAVNLCEGRDRCGKHRRHTAETAQQALGQRFDIRAR